MSRCQRCGVRLAKGVTVCPRDGAPVAPNASAEMPAPVEVAIPGYVLGRCLGTGGFGSVFEAERTQNGANVAIKVAHRVPADAAVRLEREAAALIRVGPPHVPAVHDRGVASGHQFFAMDRLRGVTLADVLEQKAGGLDLAQVGTLALAILALVEQVHAHGLMHCDLKPENIFLSGPSAVPILLDFGTVAELPGRAPAGDMPALGEHQDQGAGTPEYMSPEQCRGVALDVGSDVYALGVILCEMLTGAPPFWGASAEVRDAHMSRRPRALAGVHPRLQEVVLRCLAKSKDERFASVTELREKLSRQFVAPEGHAPESASRSGSEAFPPEPETNKTPRADAIDNKARQRRLLAVVYFQCSAPSEQLATLSQLGGQLAHRSGSMCAAVFGHEASDNPARLAMTAARTLIGRAFCKTAIVDLLTVQLQPAQGGTVRYFSPAFAKKDRYPTAQDGEGILLTGATSQVLVDLPTEAVRPGIFRIVGMKYRDETLMSRTSSSFGREETVRELVALVEKASASRRPIAALVTAGLGYGKTHVVTELVDALEKRGVVVLRIRPDDNPLRGARATTQQILRACANLPESPPSDGGKAFFVELLGPLAEHIWMAAALTLEWVRDDHPEVRRLQAAPGALRVALARVAGELLRRKATGRPFALLLDGAHLADDASLDAIDFATLADDACPLAVVATARPGFQDDRPGWCRRASLFRPIELGPLEDQPASSLARKLLEPAQDVPTWAIEQLLRRTQGVPGLLVELVRGLKRDGLVRKHERGTGHYLATEVLVRLPEMPILTWSTHRETEALPPELLAHARLASVLGAPFSRDEIDQLLFTLERETSVADIVLDTGVALTRLTEAGLLVLRRGKQFDFRTTLLREAVYDGAPEVLRRLAHRAAYLLFSEPPFSTQADAPLKLAFHAAAAGQKDDALRWYMAAGKRSLDRQLYQDAASSFDAAIAQTTEHPAAAQPVYHLRGMARFRTGRFADAASDFGKAAALAKDAGLTIEQTESLLAEATMLDWMHQLDASTAALERARESCPADPPAKVAAEFSMALGRARHRSREHEEAIPLLDEAAARAEALGDEGYEVLVISLLLLGYTHSMLGKLEASEAAFERAIQAAEARRDQAHLAAALNNRIGLWFGRADAPRLLADLRRVLTIARESGLLHMEGPVESNLGESLYCLGDLALAEEHVQRSLASHARVGASIRTANAAELLLARIQAYREDLKGVEQTIASIEARRARGVEGGESDVELSETDAVVLEAIRLTMETPSAEKWDRLFASSTMSDLAPHERADLWELRGNAELRTGQLAAGARSIEAAREIAVAQAPILAARLARRAHPPAPHTS